MRIAALMPRAMVVAALLAVGACNGPASYATKQVDVFHQRLNVGDYEAIWNETGPDIRTTTSKEGFIKMLATVHERLGNVRETRQTGWNSKMDTAGSVAELTQQTTFERGTGVETFVYKGSGDGQKLAGYHVQSNALN